jgi:hypothetical protein
MQITEQSACIFYIFLVVLLSLLMYTFGDKIFTDKDKLGSGLVGALIAIVVSNLIWFLYAKKQVNLIV